VIFPFSQGEKECVTFILLLEAFFQHCDSMGFGTLCCPEGEEEQD
jgi:hypothetical protein